MPQWTLRISAIIALLCAAVFCITSIHWPLLGDASLMHYVAFLIDRGKVPYRDIVDVNMPGTYAVEWMVVHLFGSGSLAWRLFDIALGLAATLEMMAICWPEDSLAGVLAGAAFFLTHGRDGMNELGQRDLLMTVLLLGATAFFCRALQKQRLLPIALASICAGIAVTIKPTAAIFWIAMLCYVVFSTTKSNVARLRIFLCGLSAFLIAPAIAIYSLSRQHAFGAFWQIVTGLIPLHNHLLRQPSIYFLLHPLPSSLVPVLLIWLATLVIRSREKRAWFSSTETLLTIGFLCGLASFYLQRKALPYHRYPADGFFILLVCLGFSRVLQHLSSPTYLKAVGAAGLLFVSLVVAPQCLFKTFKLSSSPSDFSGLLQKDLTTLGGSSLNKDVQCVDFTSGCITTLYRMQLEQSTGFLYDCYMFQATDNPVVRQYRETFWDALSARRPDVLIVSNQDCGRPNSFDKINRWPELASLISSQYLLYREVHPPDLVRWASTVAQPYSYRIYQRQKRTVAPPIPKPLS